MDLIYKYLNLTENKPLFPGSPEYKKKFDPSYNPYDPEGKVKKALKIKPYGYRDSKPASDEDDTPSQQPATKTRGRPKKMQSEQKNNLPFTPDKPKKPSAVAGKYGAEYSTARHLARMGLRDALKDLKKGPEAGKRQVEEFEFSESHFQVGDKVKFKMSGMKGEVVKLDKEDGGEDEKYYTVKREDGTMKKAAPNQMTKINEKVGMYETNNARLATKSEYQKSLKTLEKMPEFGAMSKSLKRRDQDAEYDKRKQDEFKKSLKKEEVEELEELDEPTVQKYITRAKFSTKPERRAMAQKAQAKLMQKPKAMKKEEVDLDEATPTKQQVKQAIGITRDKRYAKGNVSGAVKAMDKLNPGLAQHPVVKRELQKQNEEVEELKELKRSTLASYTGKAADQMAHAAIDKSSGATMGTMGRMSNMPDLAKKGSDKEDKAFQTILKRTKGITSASRRLAKEEAELEEELSSSQRDTHFSLMNKHGVLAKSAKGANKDAHRMAALDHQMALRNPENSQNRSKALSLSNKLGVKEEVNLFKKYSKLGEAKYPGFRVRMTSGGPKLPRRSFVPQGDEDPRTGMPLGFSPIKPEPKESDPSKKTKQN